MKIDTISRPWQKKTQVRYNDRGFYHTPAWKSLRDLHRKGFTDVNGYRLSNIYCLQCYKEDKVRIPASVCDHIIQREEGGKNELNNLQTLCTTHHNAKSAREKNAKYKKP
jgi:5-methylcytosine-specific restriction endonuclease McrA